MKIKSPFAASFVTVENTPCLIDTGGGESVKYLFHVVGWYGAFIVFWGWFVNRVLASFLTSSKNLVVALRA